MKIMDRAAFASKMKRRRKEVDLPDGQKALIQSISEGQRAALRAGNYDVVGKEMKFSPEMFAQQDARLLALCVIDDAGKPIFASAEEAAELDAELAVLLVDECEKFCGLSAAEDPKAKEKNSGPTGG